MSPTRFSLAEVLVLTGTAAADGIAPPTSTRISARLERVQRHFSRENGGRTQVLQGVSCHDEGVVLENVRTVCGGARGTPHASQVCSRGKRV